MNLITRFSIDRPVDSTQTSAGCETGRLYRRAAGGVGRLTASGLRALAFICCLGGLPLSELHGQAYGEPDTGQPGDAMIQAYLKQETARLEPDFPDATRSIEDWKRVRPGWLLQYYHMLGLWPLPEKTPLQATVTGTLDRGDYVVELLHYQSRPGLYVTGNLYRPARVEPGQRLPAVLYVCGHSPRGRDGNKTAYQSHGIWFARHGYICLVIDTLQMGELAGIHHGTYREQRWWWVSRGYTPAGVEAWNGVRGIDYLVSRPDVDPDRIGVTGISGGGAATFWIAAADDRVRVSVPVSGMADLESYVSNRVINGHCDCMFLYNTYQWPWTRIAALIAPRPLLFVNSDRDPIFPMDANDRVINRLERVYALFEAGDQVDACVSLGGHEYRRDIRQAAYRFFNTHFHRDPQPVEDSERDLVTGSRADQHPIPPARLRVFPTDAVVPADALNGRIDEVFVPQAVVPVPGREAFSAWKHQLIGQLREVTFAHFPERIPPARSPEFVAIEPGRPLALETEPGITVRVQLERRPSGPVDRVWLVAVTEELPAATPAWLDPFLSQRDAVYLCEPRGVGASRWTRRNPPNYVERAHLLLGRTVDSGRVWDLAATARFLALQYGRISTVHLAGEGAGAVQAAYAALLEPDIAGLVLREPVATHMSEEAPVLLNVLRVADVPEVLGLVAPRSLTLVGTGNTWPEQTARIHQAAGGRLHLVD